MFYFKKVWSIKLSRYVFERTWVMSRGTSLRYGPNVRQKRMPLRVYTCNRCYDRSVDPKRYCYRCFDAHCYTDGLNYKSKHSPCLDCRRTVLGREPDCALDHSCGNLDCPTRTRFCRNEREPGFHYELAISKFQSRRLPPELVNYCRGCLVAKGYRFKGDRLLCHRPVGPSQDA
jgi:hypothetical protein